MKKIATLLGVLLCASIAQAQPDDGPGMGKAAPQPEAILPQPLQIPDIGPVRIAINQLNNPLGKVDLSSPESTVRSFVWAANNADIAAARQCVIHAKPLDQLQSLEKVWSKGRNHFIFLISDLHTYSVAESATVVFYLNFLSSTPTEKPTGSSERLRLLLVDGNWKIIPELDNKISRESSHLPISEDLVAKVIHALADVETITADSAFKQCQSHLKQIGLSVFQFAQDYDEKFPSTDDWLEQLFPYGPGEQLFYCPILEENKAVYGYNTAFKNKTLGDIAAPAQTILFYEGQNQKIEFRHQVGADKLTNILFADGHVETFTEQTLQTALKNGEVWWTP